MWGGLIGNTVVKVETREVDAIGDQETINTAIRFTLSDGSSVIVRTDADRAYVPMASATTFDDPTALSPFLSEGACFLPGKNREWK